MTEPDNAEIKPDDTETKPDDTGNKPDDTETKPDDTANKPGDTETKPDDTETKPDNTETKPRNTENKPETNFARPSWQKRTKLFLYNPENNSIMGRTSKSWAKIGIFYICFYAGLFSLSAFMYFIFSDYTLSSSEPKLYGSHSVLNGTPGLVIIPIEEEGPVYYELKSMSHAAPYINKIERNLEENHGIKCHKDGSCSTLSNKKALDKSALFPAGSSCNKKTDFGFSIGKPCFIVKVNKLFNWKPEPYAKLSDVPSEFPKDRYRSDAIGIRCFGIHSPDKDNLGTVTYIPPTGIPFKYFPYLNKKGYVSPFMWIQLSGLQHNIVVGVRCKVYLKNIYIYHRRRIDFIDFYILID